MADCLSANPPYSFENPEGGEYDKQDCERKGFTRLAAKLKEVYPRLPILILADGLYPYEGFFAICKASSLDEVERNRGLKLHFSSTLLRYIEATRYL